MLRYVTGQCTCGIGDSHVTLLQSIAELLSHHQHTTNSHYITITPHQRRLHGNVTSSTTMTLYGKHCNDIVVDYMSHTLFVFTIL